MSTQAASLDREIAFTREVDVTRGKPLVVPMNGTGLFWSLVARYGLFVSYSHFTHGIPSPMKVRGWLTAPWYRLHDLIRPLFSFISDHDFQNLFVGWTAPLLLAIAMLSIERAIWKARGRVASYEPVVQEIARLFARYGLIAGFGVPYGLEKILGAQGAWAYEPRHLLPPYGDTGVWTTLMKWLGHSTVYENFAGWVEMSTIMLLPFRRTVTLGALISFAALVNVCIVNTAYGGALATMTPLIFIPMPIFLLLPQIKRLVSFFLGRRADPPKVALLYPPRWLPPLGRVAQVAYLGWVLLSYSYPEHAVHEAQESALAGLYRVESFSRNGKVEPEAYEFPNRWQDVVFGRLGEEIGVRTVGDTRLAYHMKALETFPPTTDRMKATMDRLRQMAKPEGEFTFDRVERGHREERDTMLWGGEYGGLHFTRPSTNEVTLRGVVQGDTLDMRLRRIPYDSLPFHAHRWYVHEWRRRFGQWMLDHHLSTY